MESQEMQPVAPVEAVSIKTIGASNHTGITVSLVFSDANGVLWENLAPVFLSCFKPYCAEQVLSYQEWLRLINEFRDRHYYYGVGINPEWYEAAYRSGLNVEDTKELIQDAYEADMHNTWLDSQNKSK